MNTTKIYGTDGNKFGHTDQDAIERFWRHLLAGGSSVRFHRPDSGLGLNDKAVACIKAGRKLESLIPLWSVEPADKLLNDRDKNEAYLAAAPGKAYAMYFPSGGKVTLDLTKAKGTFKIRWINIDTGEWGPTAELKGGGKIGVSSPGKANYAAAIVK